MPLIFSYGSNLDPDQMGDRCPSAQFQGLASLEGYKLKFSRFSKRWKGGVADVVETGSGRVWGVLYQISPEDLDALDQAEGYNPNKEESLNAYNRRLLEVAQEGSPREAYVYQATAEENSPAPSPEYLEQILRGARHWKLPEEGITAVEELLKTL